MYLDHETVELGAEDLFIEILARSIIFEDNIGEEIEINEEKTHILITKA